MKNKEIEELLNELKDKYSYEPYDMTGKVYTTISYEEGQLLLSHIEQLEKELKEEQEDNYKQSQLLVEKQQKIEQLETDYKEANESVTWWTNRYNAIVKQNDDNHKKVVKLENNRDKAIELLNKLETQPAYLDCKYYELYGFNEIKNILGDKND